MGKHSKKGKQNQRWRLQPEPLDLLKADEDLADYDFELYLMGAEEAGMKCQMCGEKKGYLVVGGQRSAPLHAVGSLRSLDLCMDCWQRYVELSLRLWLGVREGRYKMGIAMVPREVAKTFNLEPLTEVDFID